ncbi:MAG: ABC transporter substrate-binding protein [Bacillota bacterium]|nr:ABC transporter substrate-binding protein [Bacillota bacterium]
MVWASSFLNNQKPPFDNVYLRQAVDLAIDRETLVKVVFQNTASPAYGPFPPVSPAAAASGTPPKVDLQKVKELLAKGGKPNGFSFTLKIAPGPVAQQVAQVVANMLGEAGIQVDIKQVEFGTLLDDLDKGNYEAGAVGWSGRPDPDGNIYVWLHTDGNQNNSKYSNPEVDRLLGKAREVTDMKERVAVYTQVMDIVHRESPYVYLYFPKNVRGYSAKVEGFVNYPDQIIRTANLTKKP